MMQKLRLLAFCGLLAASPAFGIGGLPAHNAFLAGQSGATCTHGSTTVTATGAGSVTLPAGCTSVTEEAWGGGGSGAGNDGTATSVSGGCGAGYGKFVASGLNPVGVTVYYNVGNGAIVGSQGQPGASGQTSWVNAAANAQPVSNGAVATGGGGGLYNAGCVTPGTGAVGTTSHTGGQSVNGAGFVGSGGGGGAGSTGDGGVSSVSAGDGQGLGGTPDGGMGGTGWNVNDGGPGSPLGGGGGSGGASGFGGGSGGRGQVRLTW